MPKRAGEFVTLSGGGYSPREMFDSFWREGELALMFGAAGVGKSLLAVQVADALAGPSPIEGFRMSRSRYKVLYVDLRHSDRQFAERYSYWVEHRKLGHVRKTCKFAKNLYRSRPPLGEELCEWIAGQIAEHSFNVVIVDDLTALKKTHDGVREMLAAMRGLKRLCDELGVSVLAIACSNEPASTRQVSDRDLKHASVLCDVADTVFAIGRSRGDGRFIFQTRSRNADIDWTVDKAFSAKIARTDKGWPVFVFEKRFEEHIDEETREAICRVRAMRESGKTWRAISDELGIPKTRAVRLFNKWTPEMIEPADDAECGVRNAEFEVEDETGFSNAKVVTPSKPEATQIGPATAIPRSAIHSPQPRHGPERVSIYDLERRTDGYGVEIFVESVDEHTGKPKVWYKRDRRGVTVKSVKDPLGTTVTRLGPSEFL